MMYQKVELAYSFDGLEPYIDRETVETHYNKHLQTYLDKTNAALKGYEDLTKGRTLEELLANIERLPEDIRHIIINNGGGVSNHNLYFYILSPNPQKEPTGKLLEAINRCFGSVEAAKEELTNASIGQFGSGYGALVKDAQGNLTVEGIANQNTPYPQGKAPILLIDVWEHAYYLKYKNKRPEYVQNIWNVIDWKKVEELYECR